MLGGIGSVLLRPGDSLTVSIDVTGAVTNVAGLDLKIGLQASAGSPPLTPTFNQGAQTSGWFTLTDERDPWHIALIKETGIPGPAEMLKLRLDAPLTAQPGTTYGLEALSALLSDEEGRETDATDRFSAGQVKIAEYGDLDGDGTVDSRDVNTLFQLFLGVRPATPPEAKLGDALPVQPGGNPQRGDGELKAEDLNWLYRRSMGLMAAP